MSQESFRITLAADRHSLPQLLNRLRETLSHIKKDACREGLSDKQRLRRKIARIAHRLEELKEYNKAQALFVATEIVRSRLFHEFPGMDWVELSRD